MDQVNILGYSGIIESGTFGYYIGFKNHSATVNELAVKLGLKRKGSSYDWNIFSYPLCSNWQFKGVYFPEFKHKEDLLSFCNQVNKIHSSKNFIYLNNLV